MADAARAIPVTATTTSWRFGPLQEPVMLAACSELITPLTQCLHGWPLTPWSGGTTTSPVITVARRGTEFVLTSHFIDGEETYTDEPSIVCAFMAELIMAYGAAKPETLFLHAGGAIVENRMMIFPARGKTGKSTLIAQLAHHGARIFSDDVIPLDTATLHARALGIEPRVRLPLPAGLPGAMNDWVARHRHLFNAKMTYIGLPRQGPGALVPLGEERPVDAIVLLARKAGARAELVPCPRAEVLKQLLRQHFGGPMPAATLVARLKALTDAAPCYRLTYGGGDEAPDLLHRLAGKP